MSEKRKCPECQGMGKINGRRCSRCMGLGVIIEEDKMSEEEKIRTALSDLSVSKC